MTATNTRAAVVAFAVGLAREHLADHLPGADVTVTTTRGPKIAATGTGSRLTVTVTIVVDDPEECAA